MRRKDREITDKNEMMNISALEIIVTTVRTAVFQV